MNLLSLYLVPLLPVTLVLPLLRHKDLWPLSDDGLGPQLVHVKLPGARVKLRPGKGGERQVLGRDVKLGPPLLLLLQKHS